MEKSEKHHSLHFELHVLHTALQKELWLFHSFRGVSLQDRVKNHSKRCKIQSKRVEDHSKKSFPSYGSSKSAFSLFYTKRVGKGEVVTGKGGGCCYTCKNWDKSGGTPCHIQNTKCVERWSWVRVGSCTPAKLGIHLICFYST